MECGVGAATPLGGVELEKENVVRISFVVSVTSLEEGPPVVNN